MSLVARLLQIFDKQAYFCTCSHTSPEKHVLEEAVFAKLKPDQDFCDD